MEILEPISNSEKPNSGYSEVPSSYRKRFYDLAGDTWGNEEHRAIREVLDSGIVTMGARVETFEDCFAKRFDKKYAVMTSSGSTANLISVAALFYRRENPLKAGDEVIVPAISWATTYYPLQQYGLKLRFVDVDLHTLNMDVTQLEAALSPRTRMVVAVSILGNPAELTKMRQFCDKHDLILFEDNCESMGAQLDGKPTGTFGELNTFSTFYSHHISTIEGGVILTDDNELFQLLRAMRAHGWTRNLPADSMLFERRDDDFTEAYRFIIPGYNVRPMEISGAVGIEQIKKLDRMIEVRRTNAAFFKECFGEDPRFILQKENGISSWFSFTMIVHPETGLERSDVFKRLKAADIGYRMITGGNFLRHDVIKYFDYTTVGKIVNANTAHDRGFFVGNHPHDLRPQIERMHEVLKGL